MATDLLQSSTHDVMAVVACSMLSCANRGGGGGGGEWGGKVEKGETKRTQRRGTHRIHAHHSLDEENCPVSCTMVHAFVRPVEKYGENELYTSSTSAPPTIRWASL